MPVKLRITILFTSLVLVILFLVCGSVYYFSYINRLRNIQIRLTNRAITTGRLLSQTGLFNLALIKRIDSSTSLAMKEKIIVAYDYQANKIYQYSDNLGDSIILESGTIESARKEKRIYFTDGRKDVIAYNYNSNDLQMVIIAGAFDEDGKAHLSQLRLILALSFLGGTLISLVGGYLFSIRLLQPLRKITDEVNEISAKNLTRRISASGKNNSDEWVYLADTLNQLLNRLQESFEIQGRFIANASHELSTPLTSISNQLEVAMQRKRTSEYYEQIIQSVYEDVHHLVSLTFSLLEFAKASGTSSGLEIELIRIDEILLRLPAEMAKMNPLYAVKLNFQELPDKEEELLIFGNEELLFSAIKNVVTNACKYSGDHKAIVELIILPLQIKIMIKDNGQGIRAEELDNIFQPFYRTEDSRNIEGFGLGLALASRIVKLHKGYFQISSELNQGTEVIITLPVASRFTSFP